MRIAYITSGAAGMYCGSCMRDNTLAAALIAKGHDCVLIPTYTPLRTDEPDVSLDRVFLGGISVYLEQKSRLFRRMPGFLDRLLSAPPLLRWVSRFALNTRAEELSELTISMLKGNDGNQRRGFQRLVDWLADELRPEIVVLSNALISGMVPELKRRLNVPLLCTLQGDDIYLESLPPEIREQALALIRANCAPLGGYLLTSRYYADFMAGYLGLPRERMHVVYPGINLSGYDENAPSPPIAIGGFLTIGYLARIAPEKGLHQLVEAFGRLQEVPGVPPCRLRAAGYLGEHNRSYLDTMHKEAERQGWADRFEYVGEVDHRGKIAFLRSLDLFSVPTVYREPKGLYLLEAWACGVPAVQPRHGAFPELIEATGGGILVNPDDAAALADGLRELLIDAERRRSLGAQARAAVFARFHADRMAEESLQVFQSHLTMA